MSFKEVENVVHVTAEGILLFPQVFVPKKVKNRQGKETGEPIFSASLLLSQEGVKDTFAKVVALAKEAFGADVDLKEIRLPLISGAKAMADASAKGKDGSFYEGKTVLRARSLYAPGVMDAATQEVIMPGTTAAKKVRSGNYAHFEVALSAYPSVEDGAKPGIKAYLNHVLVTREGTPIAGKTIADAFAGILSKKSEQAVEIGDDEIPY